MAQLETSGTPEANTGEPPVLENPVLLTEIAAEKVKESMEQEGLEQHALRVGVMGGGCAGLQYLLDFDKEPTESDLIIEQHGVRIFVDPYSASHLAGTTINYVDGLYGAGFKFENPSIVRGCGCGSSFS